MALLFMDTTAAMNFLANQAGENTFTLLSPEELDESLFAKPLPMLPIESSPTRRLVAPPPSPSVLAMRKNGLETTSPVPERSLSGSNHPHGDAQRIPAFTVNAMPFSPANSSLSRSSSVYSSDSAISLDSLASGDTSISHIVEMYTDLINQIPFSEEGLGIQVLEPKAYRDTVAPLLQQRFDAVESPRSHSPVSPIPALNITKKKNVPLPNDEHKPQASVQPFLCRPRERKSELVSPLSDSDGDGFRLSNLDAMSEPSPESSRQRPFSFTSEDIIAGKPLTGIDVQTVTHSPNRNLISPPVNVTSPMNTNDRMKVSDQPERNAQQLWVEYQQRYLIPQDLLDKDLPPRPSDNGDRNSVLHSRDHSHQGHPKHSTEGRPTESIMIFNGVGLDATTVLSESLKQRHNFKDGYASRVAVTRKSPALRSEPYSPNRQFHGSPVSTPRIGANMMTNKRSTDPTAGVYANRMPRKVNGTSTVSLTTHPRPGADVWTAENKLKQREELKREARQPRKAQPSRRPNSDALYHSGPQKPSSTQNAGLIVQHSSHTRKNSFLAAIGEAKHSLTQSAADKRREKLKESIVVVGPTHMSIPGNMTSPRCLS